MLIGIDDYQWKEWIRTDTTGGESPSVSILLDPFPSKNSPFDAFFDLDR
jgi:hypothetical protein